MLSLIIIDDPQPSSRCPGNCPTGPPGRPGEPGNVGPAGPNGLPGDVGPTGSVGQDGQPGPTGQDGAVGATGASGEPGNVGPTGPSGIPGQVFNRFFFEPAAESQFVIPVGASIAEVTFWGGGLFPMASQGGAGGAESGYEVGGSTLVAAGGAGTDGLSGHGGGGASYGPGSSVSVQVSVGGGGGFIDYMYTI